MLEGSLTLVLTVVLVLLVAGAVVAGLALSRRSADEWKGVIKREGEEIVDEVRNHSVPRRSSPSSLRPVVPASSSLDALLQSGDSSSAYFDADRLPGIDRLESVTGRVSDRLDRGRRGRDGGSRPGEDTAR